jgi:hypothetical protein
MSHKTLIKYSTDQMATAVKTMIEIQRGTMIRLRAGLST